MERSLGLGPVIAISISAMLGSGIFVLPGIAFGVTGPSLWIAYLLAAVCVLPAALCMSELASAMPHSGGTYVYMERTFGPIVGSIAGIGLWLAMLLKSSFALVGFGAYLSVFADVPLRPVAVLFLVFILAINVRGVRAVGRAQSYAVLISLAGLLCLGIGGLLSYDRVHIEPMFFHGLDGLLTATGLVVVSYAGVTKVAAIAEEVKEPGRNLPRGIFVSLTSIALLYAFVVAVIAGNVPASQLIGDIRPVYSLAVIVGGTGIGVLVAILGVMTMTSMANAGLLAASRFPFAMSRDKLLPARFNYLHSVFLTPVVSITFTGVVMAGVVWFLDVGKIAKLASVYQILTFLGVNATVIVLRETAVQWYRPEFRSPFYPWVQIFGLFAGAVLLVEMGSISLVALGVACGGGLLLFYLYGRHFNHGQGVLRLYGRRALRLILGSSRGGKRASVSKLERVVSKTSETLRQQQARTDQLAVTHFSSSVVVPLFGNERSPETLVEIGAALSKNDSLDVVHLTEVPFQTQLDAMLEEDMSCQSIKRRLGAMADEKDMRVHFDAVVSHDLIRTVRDISQHERCNWLVMGWGGRTKDGIIVKNPLGWVLGQLSCNHALFKDSGVRYIRKILVHVAPGPHDRLVAETADQLASIYSAELTLMRVLPKTVSLTTQAEEYAYLNNIAKRCNAPSERVVINSERGLEAIANATISFDLLVTGAPPQGRFVSFGLGTGEDKLTEMSACSVLRLATPLAQAGQVGKRLA